MSGTFHTCSASPHSVVNVGGRPRWRLARERRGKRLQLEPGCEHVCFTSFGLCVLGVKPIVPKWGRPKERVCTESLHHWRETCQGSV